MDTYLALDLGAESGRAVLVTLDAGRVKMQEIHRFPNRPVRLGSTLFWDFPFLFAETLEAMRICSQRKISLAGIGVDTWGVDFGLLDKNDQLLANPVHYRDSRTNNIHQYSNPIMSTEDIFVATACEPWAISSLFQLLAMQKDNWPALQAAKTFLHIPDLFNFFLTGLKASERSNVSTANLMAPDGRWAREVIDGFSLPDIFPKLVEPGTVLGPLQDWVAKTTGLSGVPVIATCGHDTAAVVASVPATGTNWAFLSCGTWSIVGKLREEPLATPQCLEKGFGNEYTLGGWYTCRNVLGLWLVQELKRKWDVQNDPWDYDRMTAEAAKTESTALITVADDSLLAPVDMEKALLELAEKLGQPKCQSRGQLVRCVLESLALEYALRLEILSELAGEPTDSLFMVGGGIKNRLLCQLTANSCQIPVHAGVEQCTSVGNGLTQAVALGTVSGPDEVRTIMRNSFELITYHPEETKAWTEKLKRYKLLQLEQVRMNIKSQNVKCKIVGIAGGA